MLRALKLPSFVEHHETSPPLRSAKAGLSWTTCATSSNSSWRIGVGGGSSGCKGVEAAHRQDAWCARSRPAADNGPSPPGQADRGRFCRACGERPRIRPARARQDASRLRDRARADPARLPGALRAGIRPGATTAGGQARIDAGTRVEKAGRLRRSHPRRPRPIQQDREEMEVLFTFLAERYERRSVVPTSNLVFSQWDKIFRIR